ncbi:MAG: hypothetical protein HKP40_12135, partial [Litoreibacter sp.]|nr:hypothetical protein [Litoreibacter sp.]
MGLKMQKKSAKFMKAFAMSVALLGSTAIVTTVATTDYAYAKNGNGNGGGNNGNGGGGNNGKGGENNGNSAGKGKSASKGNFVEKSFGRSNGSKSGKSKNNALGSLKANLKSGFGLFKGSKKPKRVATATTSRAPKAVSKP